MYTKYKIKTELLTLLERLGYQTNMLSTDSKLSYDLGMDSLGALELAGALEMKYNLVISDSDFSEWVTLGDLVEYLTKRLCQEDYFFGPSINSVHLISAVNYN